MEYSKRIVILSSPSAKNGKGILSLEQTGTSLKCNFKSFGLKELSGAVLGIMLNGNLLSPINVSEENLDKFEFTLNNALKVGGKISVVVAKKIGEEIVPVLFGGDEHGKNVLEAFLTKIKNFGKLAFEATSEIFKVAKNPIGEILDDANELAQNYLDEETENLIDVEMEKQFDEKLFLKEIIQPKNSEIFTKNEELKSLSIESKGDVLKALKNVSSNTQDKAKLTDKIAGEKVFFLLVENEIEKMFETYPSESELEKLIQNSKFVKIDYDASGLFYAFGLIYGEDGDIKYICYGVPALGTQDPPEDIKEFCQWLPKNADNSFAEGYYIMFQDAKSGESLSFA